MITAAKPKTPTGKLVLEWPIRVESEANKREHHFTKARRTADQRSMVQLLWKGRPKGHPTPPLPVLVCLSRLSPRFLDDDNLANAFKHVRDELAICLLPPQTRTVIRCGVAMQERWADDSDPRIHFVYQQQKAKRHSIRVEIQTASEEELRIMRDPAALLDLVRQRDLGRPAPVA